MQYKGILTNENSFIRFFSTSSWFHFIYSNFCLPLNQVVLILSNTLDSIEWLMTGCFDLFYFYSFIMFCTNLLFFHFICILANMQHFSHHFNPLSIYSFIISPLFFTSETMIFNYLNLFSFFYFQLTFSSALITR